MPTSIIASRKRKASENESENLIDTINGKINKIKVEIAKNKIELSAMCKYGSSCYRKHADHFKSFRHDIMNDPYFLQLKNRIVSFEPDIIELLDLLYTYWKDDHFFIELDLKGLFEGAQLLENDRKEIVRFVPENTIYFYLLSIIHLNLEMLVNKYPSDKYGNHFLLSLLMQMEENSVTGLYQMYENEYKTLFGVNKVMTDSGVVEENGMITLANTTLMMSCEKKLHDSMVKSGVQSRSAPKRQKTHHKHKGGRKTKKKLRKCKTHKKRKTRRGRK